MHALRVASWLCRKLFCGNLAQIQFVLTKRGIPIEFALLKIPVERPYEACYKKASCVYLWKARCIRSGVCLHLRHWHSNASSCHEHHLFQPHGLRAPALLGRPHQLHHVQQQGLRAARRRKACASSPSWTCNRRFLHLCLWIKKGFFYMPIFYIAGTLFIVFSNLSTPKSTYSVEFNAFILIYVCVIKIIMLLIHYQGLVETVYTCNAHWD